MQIKEHLNSTLRKVKELSKIKKKKTAFIIGNTAKFERGGYYFTPIRITDKLITFGIIIFNEKFAKITTNIVDGKVDYIFADAEKKIHPRKSGDPGNIERRVKESIKKSKLLIYKGNDLTVDAVDLLLTHYFKKDITGIGGKKIAIIGAGNIGSKIALYLVERGAKVFLSRRNKKKLKTITSAINLIKPINTKENVKSSDNINACKDADILIGSADGVEVINLNMIRRIKKKAIIIDVGKGTISNEAIQYAQINNHKIFRVDISAAFEGLISKTISMEKIIDYRFKKVKIYNSNVLSAGLLGGYGDVIVDNLKKTNFVYGISNGKGDFIRNLNKKQKDLLSKIRNKLVKKYEYKK